MHPWEDPQPQLLGRDDDGTAAAHRDCPDTEYLKRPDCGGQEARRGSEVDEAVSSQPVRRDGTPVLVAPSQLECCFKKFEKGVDVL